MVIFDLQKNTKSRSKFMHIYSCVSRGNQGKSSNTFFYLKACMLYAFMIDFVLNVKL